MTFQAPADWVYATDEQIAQTMNIGLDILGDELAFNQAVTKLASVYDTVVNGTDGSSVNIMYENLALTGALSCNETDYLNLVKSQLTMLTEITYQVSDQITEVELGGQSYYLMSCITSYSGVDMVQNYYARRIGNFMNVVIVTCVGDTTPAAVEACFG